MTDELTPDQQLLLWDIGLRGGKARQQDVDYKTIAKDRNELERRGFLTLIKKPRPYSLALQEKGWNALADRTSVVPKGKKKPSRERVIIGHLLDALQSHAMKQNVGIGEILTSKPVVPGETKPGLRQRIRASFFEIAGNPPKDSVRLSALRASLHDVPRQQLDDALLEMRRSREASLMSLDNPRDINAEESTALHDGNQKFHVLWIER